MNHSIQPQPQQELSAGDAYVQLLAQEGKYFPYFGAGDFQGNYGGLSLEEMTRGILRTYRSAVEVEEKAFGQMQTKAIRVLAADKKGGGRFEGNINHVLRVTKARIERTKEALEGLEALIGNMYGSREGDTKSNSRESDTSVEEGTPEVDS